MGGFQGFLGWYMVKSGLVDIPHVSHYRLALHLSLAFFILSYIYKLKLSLLVTKLSKDCNYKYYDRLISIIIGLLFIQIVYGAFNAGLKTVNTVNTFPFYNGSIFPSSNISFDSFWLFFFENHYGVQIIHRFLGLMIMGLIMFFSYKSSMSNSRIKLESQYLIVLILFQCIVGILTLISDASIVFALLHQFLAILTILFTIKIKHKLRYEK
jgi:cytochrome c oxidase assembly protein subunit 15